MSTQTKNYQIIQKIAADEYILLHPETDASIVELAAEGITADNVKDAILELKTLINDITGGGVVTGIKGSAESSYRQGNVEITKANVGLGNVDNTADADKPISTATQTALDKKANSADVTTELAKKANTADVNTELAKKADSSDVTGKLALKADKSEITDFITKAVNDLTYYYTKTQIDGKVEDLEDKISAIPKFAIAVVDALPTTGISSTTIYLKKTSTTETGNLYTEYIYVNNAWESLGTQTLDLSGYATKDYVTNAIKDFLTATQINTAITNALKDYVKSSSLADIATSGKLSDATDDATHRLVTDTEKSTWNAKQDALTYDDAPTASSTKHVKSGAVYAADKAIDDKVTNIVNGTTKVAKAAAADSATNATNATNATKATNADAAAKLSTARNIALSGDATGNASFDGSADKTIAVTLANSGVSAGSYSAVTVDAKGRVTAGAQLVEVGSENQTTPTNNLAVGGLFFKLM